MFHVEDDQIEVVYVEYLQEQVAASQVRCGYTILYIHLELGDSVEQALDRSRVEQRFILSSNPMTP